jgi:hypothetical protein
MFLGCFASWQERTLKEHTSAGATAISCSRIGKQGGREIARVKTGLAFFDYAKTRIAKMPERFRAALAPA